MKDLQCQVTDLLKSGRENRNVMEILMQQSDEMEQRANYQKYYNRRSNLRISGVPEQPRGETWEVTANAVSKLIQEKEQLPPIQFERAHHAGQTSPTVGRLRTIVARFEKFSDREVRDSGVVLLVFLLMKTCVCIIRAEEKKECHY